MTSGSRWVTEPAAAALSWAWSASSAKKRRIAAAERLRVARRDEQPVHAVLAAPRRRRRLRSRSPASRPPAPRRRRGRSSPSSTRGAPRRRLGTARRPSPAAERRRSRAFTPSRAARASARSRSGPSPATTSETPSSRRTARSATSSAFCGTSRPARTSVGPSKPWRRRSSSRSPGTRRAQRVRQDLDATRVDAPADDEVAQPRGGQTTRAARGDLEVPGAAEQRRSATPRSSLEAIERDACQPAPVGALERRDRSAAAGRAACRPGVRRARSFPPCRSSRRRRTPRARTATRAATRSVANARRQPPRDPAHRVGRRCRGPHRRSSRPRPRAPGRAR